jgi:hypothetical protein
MRRRKIIWLTLLVSIAIWFRFLSPDTNPDDNIDTSVSLAFKDRDAGPPFGARGFDLTNSGPKSIGLTRLWVQKWEDGRWTNSLVQFSTVVPFGDTNTERYNPVFEPGECRRVVAAWPTNAAWRVEIQYAIEMSAISKAEIALKTRDVSHMTNRSWNGTHYAFSKVIRK